MRETARIAICGIDAIDIGYNASHRTKASHFLAVGSSCLANVCRIRFESIVSQIVDVAALWNAAELRMDCRPRPVPIYAA